MPLNTRLDELLPLNTVTLLPAVACNRPTPLADVSVSVSVASADGSPSSIVRPVNNKDETLPGAIGSVDGRPDRSGLESAAPPAVKTRPPPPPADPPVKPLCLCAPPPPPPAATTLTAAPVRLDDCPLAPLALVFAPTPPPPTTTLRSWAAKTANWPSTISPAPPPPVPHAVGSGAPPPAPPPPTTRNSTTAPGVMTLEICRVFVATALNRKTS